MKKWISMAVAAALLLLSGCQAKEKMVRHEIDGVTFELPASWTQKADNLDMSGYNSSIFDHVPTDEDTWKKDGEIMIGVKPVEDELKPLDANSAEDAVGFWADLFMIPESDIEYIFVGGLKGLRFSVNSDESGVGGMMLTFAMPEQVVNIWLTLHGEDEEEREATLAMLLNSIEKLNKNMSYSD